MTLSPTIIPADEKLRRSYWFMGGLWTILADTKTTDGRYSVLEEHLPQGVGAAPHVNEGQDETFAVLEGEVTFWVDGQITQVKGGSFLFIPRDVKHAFRVDSAKAHMLNQHAPAGFGQFVTTFGKPAEALTMPPAGWEDKAISADDSKELFADIRQINLDMENPLGTPASN